MIGSDEAGAEGGPPKGQLQALGRGLLALRLVAEAGEGISVAHLAERLGVDRAVAHRIAATLRAHSMVVRAPDGRLRLGSAPLVLAALYDRDLRVRAVPLVRRLASATSATAFLSVAEGADCVAIATAEPERPVVSVGYRTGRRHPLTLGAAGIAILAGRPEREDDLPSVRAARARGHSVTRGQLQPGAVGVAAPLRLSPALHPGLEASIGVVAMEDLDVEAAIAAVTQAAAALSDAAEGAAS